MIRTGWLEDRTCETLDALTTYFPTLAWTMKRGRVEVRVGKAHLLVRLDVYRRWRVTLTLPTGHFSDSTHYPFDAWYSSAITSAEAIRLYLTDLLEQGEDHPAHQALELARAALRVFDEEEEAPTS